MLATTRASSRHLPIRGRRLAGDDAAGVPAGAAEGGLRAGLRPVRRDRGGGGAHHRAGDQHQPRPARLKCFELDADTVIETHDYGAMTVAELERLMRTRRRGATSSDALLGQLPRSDAGADGLRISSTAAATGLGIYDTMTGNDLASARAGAVRAV